MREVEWNPRHRARWLTMSLVPSFTALAQPLACGMTAPTFANFLTILTGWVFADRRTVTGMLGRQRGRSAAADTEAVEKSSKPSTLDSKPPHNGESRTEKGREKPRPEK